jgi:hypothetical protein
MDFYYMRLLITITPTSVRAVPALPSSGPLAAPGRKGPGDADPFERAVRRLPDFDSAVLTAFDEQGVPTLLRVRPSADPMDRTFTFVTDAPLRPGKASLLCHSHDEELWNLRSFVVTGDLTGSGAAWTLRPDRFVAGPDKLGPLAMIKMIRELRSTARRYLERRGLSRPEIPWREIHELYDELGPAT